MVYFTLTSFKTLANYSKNEVALRKPEYFNQE